MGAICAGGNLYQTAFGTAIIDRCQKGYRPHGRLGRAVRREPDKRLTADLDFLAATRSGRAHARKASSGFVGFLWIRLEFLVRNEPFQGVAGCHPLDIILFASPLWKPRP